MIFAASKQRRKEAQFASGYDYAAGALLRGSPTREELAEQAYTPFDRNEFDRGMAKALADWHNKKPTA